MIAPKPLTELFDRPIADRTDAEIRALATTLEAARQDAGMAES
jgi:hypothetical protein